MNCLNGEKYLREAIESIYFQTYTDWEIVFWDNASSDKSGEIAKSYDSRLRYFRGNQTIPLYAARNLALKQAEGKYIAFLDTDDLWLPKKLEWQVPLFENDKKIGLVYSNVKILEANGSIRMMRRNNRQPSGRIFRQLIRHYNINLQTAMISRTALDSLKDWFDELLNHAGDTDLFLRIAHDWDLKYLPGVTAKYREHGENLSLKYAEDIPVELEYILGKLSNLYKDFRKEYKKEIIEFRMRAQKGLTVSKWRSGKNSEARLLMLHHLLSMRSFILLYLLSFFPYEVMSSLRNNILKWLQQLKSS
ncbi:glycosyltransferase [bacterium]|nr:glycosyltransferase [bacterium]